MKLNYLYEFVIYYFKLYRYDESKSVKWLWTIHGSHLFIKDIYGMKFQIWNESHIKKEKRTTVNIYIKLCQYFLFFSWFFYRCNDFTVIYEIWIQLFSKCKLLLVGWLQKSNIYIFFFLWIYLYYMCYIKHALVKFNCYN